MKFILLYDFLLVKGGAENVALTLINHMKNMDLCVAFSDPKNFSTNELTVLPLIELSEYTALMGWQSIKALFAFNHKAHFIQKYQSVLYSGIYSPIAIKHHTQRNNIYYCHTPPRFIYDLKHYYLQKAQWWQKPLLKLLSLYVQYHYEKAIAKMDIIIANSENVRQRIQSYLGYEAMVIYPPVDVDQFNWIQQGDYYLSTARVESYKRVELIVNAFMLMPNKKLIVASSGSELAALKIIAQFHSNIHFTGLCTIEQLHTLIGSCIATIYIPYNEDFGISPVESMAAGKPVIGVAEGGLLETIIHNKTGFLIENTVNSVELMSAVEQMTAEKSLSMRKACENRAQLYRTDLFLQQMEAVLSRELI
jgi:glycosyltransferase involved in cell wall biosynthesis